MSYHPRSQDALQPTDACTCVTFELWNGVCACGRGLHMSKASCIVLIPLQLLHTST